jgi:hypothetical protein
MRRTVKTTTLGLFSTLLLGAAMFACSPGVAEAHTPWNNTERYRAPMPAQDLSLTLESPGGGSVQTYWHAGSLYAAGNNGGRYNIRLQNNTGERVEAVVTVDGRDVVSGELGNYKRQRGYVIEAYGSVVIEGFRQSLDQVAAFRFTDIGNSYSARRGSGQHVGVIGVAVFKEYQPRRPQPRPPTPIATRPYYEPYGGGGYDYRGEASKRAEESNAPAADAAAPSSAPMGGARATSVRRRRRVRGEGGPSGPQQPARHGVRRVDLQLGARGELHAQAHASAGLADHDVLRQPRGAARAGGAGRPGVLPAVQPDAAAVPQRR